MSAAMTDIALIGYCEIHCTTERALFAAEHVNRMIELAGNPPGFKRQSDWVSAHEEMQELCELARARIVPPAPPIAPSVSAGELDMVRQELIEAGVIGADVAPMSIASAVVAKFAAQAQEQEPVAEFGHDTIFVLRKQANGERFPKGTKLYASPVRPSAVQLKADERALPPLPKLPTHAVLYMQNGYRRAAVTTRAGDPMTLVSTALDAMQAYARSAIAAAPVQIGAVAEGCEPRHELYLIRRQVYDLSKRLINEELDADDIVNLGKILCALSQVCPDCHGEGDDGDAPDANGEGGWVGRCGKCGGTGINLAVPAQDDATAQLDGKGDLSCGN